MPLHLLKRLWQRSPQVGVGTASVPPGMRIYAIGDIHGRFDLLRQLHQAIRADCADVSPLTNNPLKSGFKGFEQSIRTRSPKSPSDGSRVEAAW